MNEPYFRQIGHLSFIKVKRLYTQTPFVHHRVHNRKKAAKQLFEQLNSRKVSVDPLRAFALSNLKPNVHPTFFYCKCNCLSRMPSL